VSLSDDEAQILAELTLHPAWNVLQKVAKERMERQFRLTAGALMSGTKVDVEEIEYQRGFFAGMKHLLDKPQLEAAEIARELAKREEVKLDA